MTYEVLESNPRQSLATRVLAGRVLVTRIEGKNLPFGGEWIFELSPAPEGCRLNITERGEIYNPVFRFISRFVLGYNGTLDNYLRSVALKFAENTTPAQGTPAQP